MLGITTSLAMVLVIPVSMLLFLQWPLREIVQAYSREANDLAQALFALYVSVAVTYATRQRAHLAADVMAQGYPATWRNALSRLGSLMVLVPWSLFVLWAAFRPVLQSVMQLESFPESFNPGYFTIKIALWLLALLVLLQALIDSMRKDAHP